jgi:hypothetical protein
MRKTSGGRTMPATSRGRSKKHPVYIGVYISKEIADALNKLAARVDDEDDEPKPKQYWMRRAFRELLVKEGVLTKTAKRVRS